MSAVFSKGISGNSSGTWEDNNVRVWKAEAAAPMGPLRPREKEAVAYRSALKAKFSHLPEIKRIAKHHHVPKYIKRTTEKLKIRRDAAQQKEERRTARQQAKDKPKKKTEKQKPVLKEIA
eukprot:GDKH01012573.1.p3 GENE.GDKH01012573.1~~GDKH01012573.1.p3  ORF type:complete len:120 (+),score=29.86 GDKH01012573.1:105-464(+)